jgi:D-glycero-alpha-D-manno-heptose-7-phosphate kinase
VTRSPFETAQLANEVERFDIGNPGGDQDSMGAALGGFNHLEYVKGGGTVPHAIDVDHSLRLAIEHDSLLLYTGEAHLSGSIHQDIKDSYALEHSPTVAAMQALRSAAQQMVLALREGDLSAYLESLNHSCDSLYRLHPGCDSDSHRKLCRELAPYIQGRKTCGAGGGGFILVHTRPGCRYECAQRAEACGALVWPVSIDFDGVTAWEGPDLESAQVDAFLRRGRQ